MISIDRRAVAAPLPDAAGAAGGRRAHRDPRRRLCAARRGRHAARPRQRHRGSHDAPSAAARRRPPAPLPPARTAEPTRSTLSAYFETGFDLPFKLSEEFTKQYPNVTWDIKQDQFTNLMTATPRLLSGDNPPDLDPAAVDGLARQGRAAQEPRRLRDGLRLGPVAAPRSWPRTASPRTARADRARCTRWA